MNDCLVSTMPRGVKMRTTIETVGVAYSVELNSDSQWERYVVFDRDTAHQAGGSAFQQAAQEQQRIAEQLLAFEANNP